MEWLNQVDTQLLLLLNSKQDTFWDMVMVLITRKETWLSLYLITLIVLGAKYKRSTYIIIPMLILTIVVNDQFSNVIKDAAGRLRPWHDPNLKHLINIVHKPGGMYGFFSAHAANAFGFAIFTSKVFRNSLYSVFFILWAIMVSYSRVYLGVHFPGDVICGAIVGSLIGWGMYKLTLFIEGHIMSNAKRLVLEKLSNRDALLIILATVVSIITIFTSVTKLMKYGFLS